MTLENDKWDRVVLKITPFGWLLQSLLSERTIRQNDLARKLGMAPSNLSNLLRGRKGGISTLLIDEISSHLLLSSDERNLLHDAALLSMTNFEINNMSPWQYSLACRFFAALHDLPPDIGKTIAAALAIDKNNKAPTRELF